MSRRSSKAKSSRTTGFGGRLRRLLEPSARPVQKTRHLQFEALEDRQLLSAAQPIGPEFQVNTYTTNNQEAPKVASDAAGDYVVVWESFNQDIGIGIFGQRYNASGATQGSEFRISSNTTNIETNPSVAMDSNGDFVVAWQSYKYSSNDGYGDITDFYDVYAQRYDASGRKEGSNFEVNSREFGQQFEPSAAMDPEGDFVIAWSGYGDHSGQGIFAQRYNANGAPVGVSNFQVNLYTDAGQFNPSAAMDAEGDFVIAWSSVNEDGSVEGIYAQRFDPIGAPLGLEFQVNTYTLGIQQAPSIASDSAGDFVIAWESGPFAGTGPQDGSAFGVYAQLYDSGGATVGSEFRVNTYTTDSQFAPAAAMDSSGDFEIAWVSGTFNGTGSATQDGSGYGIYAQQYNASGGPQGSEFRVNTYTTGNQGQSSIGPAIAADASGDFVVAWASEPQDGSEYGIYAQRYAIPDTATQLVVTMQPPGTVTAGSGFGFTVTAEDAQGHLATGFNGSVTVALAANPGSSTLGGTLTAIASNSTAVFSGLNLNKVGNGYTLNVTSGGLTPATSSAINVTPGAATQLVINTQPPTTVTAGTGFGLTVTAEDAEGNVATGFAGSVTVGLANNPGSSTLSGTTTLSAASGVAVFSSLTLNKAGTGYTLSLASPSLTSATSSSFNVIPSAATQLVITSAFPTNVTAGAPFGFTASAEDAEGNVTPGFTGSVSVAISTNPGSSNLSGTTTLSAASGVAVFSGLALNNTGTGYKLSVTTSGLSATTVGPFNVTALGVATHLVVETLPPATVVPGAAFGVTVEAEDDFGTVDTSFNGGVTIALANNPGASTLAGTLSASASAGVAAFSGLSLNNPGLGYALQATTSGLTTGTTGPFNVVGTLTITGTATNSPVQITFIDATDFQVIPNGGAATTYSTTAATKVVYNGPSGTFSEVVFADKFNTYTATQSFASTDIVTGGFEFDANNVVNLYIYAPNGQSTATVSVGTGTESNFYVGDAGLDYSYIGNPATGLYSELSGFASETITGSGSTTYAYVYSTSHGALVGDPGGSTYTASGFTLSLKDFPQVYAVGAADGTDNMTLHTAGGSFVGQPSFSYVSGTFSGASFLIGALFAANVTTQATNPTDQAFFYSYAGNTFNGAQGSSSLTGSATGFASFSTFVSQATGFQSVSVLESGAGTDVANLTSPGNGTFTETASASTLAVGGVTVITVNTFFNNNGTLVAVPSKVNITGGASDTANLYDSAGSNALVAEGNKATLTTSVNSIVVTQFGKVNAFQTAGTSNTVHQQAIDFALQTIGNWTSV